MKRIRGIKDHASLVAWAVTVAGLLTPTVHAWAEV